MTVLDLAPVLNPLFTKCISDIANTPQGMSSSRAVAKLKSECLAAAKTEINRQGGIYTSEERAYMKDIKSRHQEAKVLSFTLIEITKQLDAAWNDQAFAEMGPKVKFVEEMAHEAHQDMQSAVAHQGWRGNVPWNFADAEKAVGKEAQTELFQLFKSHRDPMISETAEIKTFVIKLDEFTKRAQDSLKTAQSCKARARVNITEFVEQAKKLLVAAVKAKNDVDGFTKSKTVNLQKFMVLCNTKKTKLDPMELKAADGNQAAGEIWLKNTKTTTKTLEVEQANAVIKAQKSVAPTQAGLVLGALSEALTNLNETRKSLVAFSLILDAHKKKLTEAKTRK